MASDPLFKVFETWEHTTLGEACFRSGGDIQTGPFGSQLHASDYVPEGIPTIMPLNISNDRISEEGIARIAPRDVERLSRYVVQAGDIVYSRRGDVERRALVTQREAGWLCGTGCLRVRLGRGDVDPQYTYYYLGHPDVRAWVVRHAVGDTMPNLNTSILSALPFVLPPLSEQRSIASILGALDDKIELNRRINATLEESTRGLFKSWFVDFDPVQAKAAGREPEGLDAEMATLFPDRLVESEMGLIPEGWSFAPLGDLVEAVKGLSYKGEGLADSGIPLHNLNSVYEGGGYKYQGIKYYSGEYRERHIARAGDLIVANTEQGHHKLLIGYPAIIPQRYGDQGIFSHHLYKVTPISGSPISAVYLYFLLRTSLYHDIVSGYTNGTTVNMLPADGLEKPLIVVPPQALIEKFDEIGHAALRDSEALYEQSQSLTAIRDTLLPKLLSGEIRLGNGINV